MKVPFSPPEYSRFRYGWRPPFKAARHRLQFALAWLLLRLARLLPVRGTQAAGRWMGRLLFPLARRDRAIADYQLGLVFPELTRGERLRLARQSFENMGTTLWEVFAIPNMRKNSAYWVRREGEDQLRAALAEGRGVVLVTAHAANWEMLGLAVEQGRIPAQAVVRSIENPLLNGLLLKTRASTHLKFFGRGSRESPRQLLNCLRSGSVLVVALDHDTVAPGVFVDFFGMSANTPRVAASLALRAKVPVVTGLDQRQPNGTHLYRYRRVTYPDTLQNNPEGVKALTQLLSNEIEAHIRQFPQQWTWNHRRWKRRPTDTGK